MTQNESKMKSHMSRKPPAPSSSVSDSVPRRLGVPPLRSLLDGEMDIRALPYFLVAPDAGTLAVFSDLGGSVLD